MTRIPAVIRITNRAVAANTYLVLIGPGICVIVDPGLDHESIEAALDEHRLVPTAIYCTHGHFDHIGSAERFRRRYGVPVYLHSADVAVARRANLMMMALKLPMRIDIPENVSSYDDPGAVAADGIQIVSAPGHTKGSVVLRIGAFAFTGDTVYRDDLYRTRWPETDDREHERSLRNLLALLPDDTMVYPGHGGSATILAIRRENVPLQRALGSGSPL